MFLREEVKMSPCHDSGGGILVNDLWHIVSYSKGKHGGLKYAILKVFSLTLRERHKQFYRLSKCLMTDVNFILFMWKVPMKSVQLS